MKEAGVMSSVMVHALRAFRSHSDLLTNTMDVFIKEPSFDWKVGLFLCTFHLLLQYTKDLSGVSYYMMEIHQIVLVKIFTLFCVVFFKINIWGQLAWKPDTWHNLNLEKTVVSNERISSEELI